MVRLVAVDLDRTLLNDDRQVSAPDLAALRIAAERGIDIALCSGRDLPSTLAVSEPMKLSCWLVIQNGSLVIDPAGEAVYVSSLALETFRNVMDVLQKHRLAPVVYDVFPNARRFWWQEGAQAAPGMLKFRLDHGGEATIVRDIRSAVNGPVSHCEVYDEAERVLAAEQELAVVAEVVAVSNRSASLPGNVLMGIYPAGTSKEASLERVIAILGVSSREVLAIGDNLNDVGMVRWAGVGVMMANGPEEARAAADWVAPSNNESGVATALERFAGIEVPRR